MQIEELWQRLGGLPSPHEARDIWDDIWHAEAHHSTAIEGNTLRQEDVDELLRTGKTSGDKLLTEYLEVKGYSDAARWVYGQALQHDSARETITLYDVRTIHSKCVSPLWNVVPPAGVKEGEGPGCFRQCEIERFAGGMQPPSHVVVHAEMTAWLEEVNALVPRAEDFAEEVARLHCRFEQIHPFFDGNGRTGRLLLNLVLVRLGYPPAIIYAATRDDYLRALRRADKGDCGQLGEFIARAILDNLYKFVVPAIAGPARLVPLGALATNDLNANALRSAASRGSLEAAKGADGQWRSSQNWVDAYKQSRYARKAGRAEEDESLGLR